MAISTEARIKYTGLKQECIQGDLDSKLASHHQGQ